MAGGIPLHRGNSPLPREIIDLVSDTESDEDADSGGEDNNDAPDSEMYSEDSQPLRLLYTTRVNLLVPLPFVKKVCVFVSFSRMKLID